MATGPFLSLMCRTPVIRVYSLQIPCYVSITPRCVFLIPECHCDLKGTLSGVGECEQVFSVCILVDFTHRWESLHFFEILLLLFLFCQPVCNIALSVFEQKSGQCHCKPHVCGHACDSCKEGYFLMQKKDYFGCESKRFLFDIQ